MHEGFDDLTVVGEAAMTWMTFYGVSKNFLSRLTEMQLKGVTGHIEWFPSTIALREGFRMTFVEHPYRGTLKYHQSVGSTFTYCCGAYTADAEGWYEGWKTAEGGFCAPPFTQQSSSAHSIHNHRIAGLLQPHHPCCVILPPKPRQNSAPADVGPCGRRS